MTIEKREADLPGERIEKIEKRVVKMALDEWDRYIKPELEGLTADARWLQHYAKSSLVRLKNLPFRPLWETNAEAELDEALRLLTEVECRVHRTLADITAIRAKYRAKETIE